MRLKELRRGEATLRRRRAAFSFNLDFDEAVENELSRGDAWRRREIGRGKRWVGLGILRKNEKEKKEKRGEDTDKVDKFHIVVTGENLHRFAQSVLINFDIWMK